MLRFLNIAAILALVGSAIYAYSIKYQTSYRAEQIVKTKLEIKAEHDAIAVLRAEWSFMTRPERVQQLADRYLDLQPLTADKIETARGLPERPPHVDAIAAKIDTLGLGVASTPAADPGAAPTTPKTPAKTSAATQTKGTGHQR
jgi:cell division protein FtsL